LKPDRGHHIKEFSDTRREAERQRAEAAEAELARLRAQLQGTEG
jgi:hypothetical protein